MPPLVVDVLNNYRERLLRDDDAALREMARAWLLVEQALRAEFEALAERAQRENLTPALLRRSARVRSLLAQTRIELERYADRVADQITAQQLRAGILGIDQAVGALNAVALQNGAAISFDRLPVAAVESLVGLAGDGSPVRDVLRDATGIGVDAALRELLLGVALGRNPLETARRMLRLGLGQSFSRMATIARTEKMRVWRQTTLQSYRNSPVVVGYRRLAAKSERTCLGCLFADGRFYRLDEEFDEHPNGRCTLVPVLDSAEPVGWETGQTWFTRQSEIMQRVMLGPARFELWRSGQVTLEDMVLRRSNPTWGGALVPKPVRDLTGGRPSSVTRSAPQPPTRRGTIETANVESEGSALERALVAAERSIYHLRTHEEAYVVDREGNLLLHKGGGQNYVEFTDSELELLNGAVLTHNHPLTPEGTSFSPADIHLSLRSGVDEVRAVGGRYVHTLRMGSGLTWDDILVLLIITEAEVKREFSQRVQRGEMTADEAELHHYHEVWTRMGRELSEERWRYERREHGYNKD